MLGYNMILSWLLLLILLERRSFDITLLSFIGHSLATVLFATSLYKTNLVELQVHEKISAKIHIAQETERPKEA